MNSFKIVTLGCKVNGYEAQSVHDEMVKRGYFEANDDESADIYVLFTCVVTNVAESKTRKKIHQIKRENKDAIICVVGCYVQVHKDELDLFDGIDIIVGANFKDQIVNSIEEFIKNRQQIILTNNINDEIKFSKLTVNSFNKQTRAYLKIQDGCDQYCSYCIIPFARGHERSMDMDEAIQEAKHLVANGHKEIVLTGIHTGRYRDLKGHHLVDLLKELVKIEGLKRIRLSSIEITEVTDEIIDLYTKHSNLAPHFHIPLQAGSDKILKLMNRPYDMAYFNKRIAYIREKIPNCSISTDLIVGFPDESDEDFMDTYQSLKDVNFSFIHTFPYASKKGTKASLMKNQVDGNVKKHRVNECLSLSKELYHQYQSQFIGKVLNVLIEESGVISNGHSREYIKVFVNNEIPSNEIVDIMITGINDEGLVGELYETR